MGVVSSVWDTGGSASGAAGGDLSGTYPDPTVATVGGKSAAAIAAAVDATPTGSIPYWSYLKPPAVPHAHDDYFDNASIAGAWSEFDPGTNTTITETAANRLKITQTTHAGDSIAGLIRPAPADNEYNVTVGFSIRGVLTNFAEVGLIAIGSDAISAPTTANILFAAPTLANNESSYGLLAFTAYNAFSATDGNLADGGNYRLVRWHVNVSGDRIAMLVSTDGRDWIMVNNKILSTASLTDTAPAYLGPAVNNIGTGSDVSGVFDLYQIEVTADAYSPCGGWVDLGTV